VNYNGIYDISNVHNGQFSTPGTGLISTYTQAGYMNLSSISLPIPKTSVPFQPVLVTERSSSWNGYDDDFPNPYIQSFNLSIQRDLGRDLNLEVRYVGTKSTKLQNTIPLNDANIFENGILEAFRITRAGGNAPLFDQMLNGLNLGSGVVNGTTVTGWAALRQSTLTRGFLANGNVGQFADFLFNSPTATGVRGGLVRNGGFPENFIKVNPQFQSVGMVTHPNQSNYHSLNFVLSKRMSRGFTYQTQYTWSRTIGDDGTYLNPRNRALNKQLLSFHRTHDFRVNGVMELPFGPGKRLLGNAPSWLSRFVERWQLAGIFSLASGAPLTVSAPVSTITQSTGNTPTIWGDFPKTIGNVTKVVNGVIYFDGLQQVTDPAISSVTPSQSLQGQFSNKAIADSQGRILLANPSPGELGTLGLKWIEGPGNIGLDMNLAKKVKISESKEFELRVDAVNVLNHPNFGNPNVNINSVNFGRITTATGSRSFVINSRLNF